MRSALLAAMLVASFVSNVSARESAIQITRQGPAIILVQKDVGAERWAINLSLEETSALELTGNVFRPGGSAAFLQCRPVDVLNPNAPLEQRSVVYDCFGADTCRATSTNVCDPNGWGFIDTVTIPMPFFLP